MATEWLPTSQFRALSVVETIQTLIVWVLVSSILTMVFVGRFGTVLGGGALAVALTTLVTGLWITVRAEE